MAGSEFPPYPNYIDPLEEMQEQLNAERQRADAAEARLLAMVQEIRELISKPFKWERVYRNSLDYAGYSVALVRTTPLHELVECAIAQSTPPVCTPSAPVNAGQAEQPAGGSQKDLPRCPECGYTKEDSAMWLDHHLCKGKIPEARNAE
jgi:hypothetical protein